MAEVAVVAPRHGPILTATAGRVLRQLRHDPRSLALMLLAPVFLLGLLAWVLSGQPGVFDEWGALLLAVFPLLLMFILTSVATLQERTGGTLAFVAILNALLGTSLGLFASAFAKTEFQAVQMLPVVLLPQLLLCGIVAPTSSLPQPLEAVSYVLPLTYSIDAMKQLTIHSTITGNVWRDIAVLVVFIVALVVAGAATLNRRTP